MSFPYFKDCFEVLCKLRKVNLFGFVILKFKSRKFSATEFYSLNFRATFGFPKMLAGVFSLVNDIFVRSENKRN